ncbi:MAG: UMP kinase [Candidatus Eisenbacteria bacterium]
MSNRHYRRVVLKLSGEVLGGSSETALEAGLIKGLLGQIKEVVEQGTEIGIVVGGGNVLRGGQAARHGLGRISADHIGMLGTVINGVALRDIGAGENLDIRVMSPFPCANFVEPYTRERAREHLAKGRVAVFVGGTGNPLLTTDTAAAVRAAEIDAEALLKGTKVDGVYTADPVKDPKAEKFERITFRDAMKRELGFMDSSALWICSQTNIPVIVFNILEKDGLKKAARGEKIGTVVEEGPHD